MFKLVEDGHWQHDAAEQNGQNFDGADQNQIVRRPGVRDDQHATSNTKLVQYPTLAAQIRVGVRFVNAVRLEEAVDVVENLEPESFS